MSDNDNISFEDDNIEDMEMDFDELSMGAEDQPDTRDPVTKLKSNFFQGALTQVRDKRYLEEEVKRAVPDGYSATYDEAKNQYNQLDKASRNLINPIRKELPQFKRNLNRLSPMVKRVVGDRFGNKFDELTKTTQKNPDLDPDQVEMQSGLSNIFGVWRESQLADRENDMADKLMDARTDEERFKANYSTLNKVANYMSRQVAFNDGVLIKVHEKSLELDFKKFHLLRNLLKVTTEGYNTSIGELKAITKNTGLPDIIKRQNSENFKQLFLDEWQGRTTANIVDFGKDYFANMAKNIQKKAEETGTAIAEGMGTLGDVASSFADMDEMQREMGGPEKSGKDLVIENMGKMGGNAVSKKVVGFFADMLNKRMKDDPTAQSTNSWLQYLMSNKEQLLKDYVDDKAQEDGFMGKFFEFIQGVSPTIGKDREALTNTLAAKATQEAQWDRISRETLVKIIPGWLSKIHHVLNMISKGTTNVEAETFDIYSETFVKQSEALSRLQSKLVDESSISSVRDDVDSVIDALFKSNEDLRETLTEGQVDILENAIIRSANNDVGTDLRAFGKSETFNELKGTSEEDAEAIAKALSKVLGLDGPNGGKFTKEDFKTKGDVADRSRNVIRQFKKLKNSNPETQSVFNLLNATGGTSQLEALGYGKRDEEGVLNLDFDNLYNRKLGKYTANINPLRNDDNSVGSLSSTVDNTRTHIEQQMSTVSLGSEQYDALETQLNKLNATSNRIADLVERGSGNRVQIEQDSIDAIGNAIKAIYQSRPTASRNSTTQPEGQDDSVISKLTETNLTLGDVRGVLLNMFAAQQSHHDELMGRSNTSNILKDLGTGVSNFIKAPFKLVTNAFTSSKEFAKKHLNKVKDLGKNLIGAPINFTKGVLGEISAQVLSPPDIYVVGQPDPAILGKDLKKGIFFNVDVDNNIGKTPIKEIGDITGKVVDVKTNSVVISLEEYQLGLETRVPTKAKRVGGALAKVAMLPINLTTKAFKVAKSLYDKGSTKVKDMLTKAKEKAKAFTIFSVTGELLASKEDIANGMFYIIKDGKQVTVTSVAEMTDTVYRYIDGEPIITVDQIRQGFRDKFGKLIKLDTNKVMDKITKGGKLIGKLLASPFKLMGKGTKALLKIFEGKLVSSLLVNVPDNVIFKANVVNLFTDNVNTKGKGTPDEPNPNKPSNDEQTTSKPVAQMSKEEKLNALKDKLTTKVTKAKDDLVKKKTEFMSGKGKELKEDTILKSKGLKEKALKKKDELRTSKFMVGLTSKVDKLVASSKDAKANAKGLADNVASKVAAENARTKALDAWGKLGKKKSVRGDGDGDGLRDGGWKEQLRDRAKALKNKVAPKKDKEKKDKDSGGNKLIKALSLLISPIISMLGSLTGLPVISTLAKIGSSLGLGTLATGAVKGLKSVVSKGAAKIAGKTAVKAAVGFGAKKLAGAAVAGGAAAAGLAVGGLALAPIIGVGLAVWTAFEIGSALWGYFDRRSDMMKIEYLRMLSYGYYVGDDGDYEDRKVTLRYFEEEMLDRMEDNGNGVVVIGGSTDELWEEYCGEFGSSYGDTAAKINWTRWFEERFKPVFFKWISVVAKLNEKDKSLNVMSKTYSLSSLDSKLVPENYPSFVKAVLNFPELDHDPLESSASAYTKIGIQAKRAQVQAFADKSILKKVQGKVIKEAKEVKTPDQIKDKKAPKAIKDTNVKVLGNPVSEQRSKINPVRGGGNTTNKFKLSAPVTYDPRHAIVTDTLNGDSVTKARLKPLVDSTLTGILSGKSGLSGQLRKEFEELVPLEDSGKSGSLVNEWITQVLIPTVRDLAELIGTSEGQFNDITPDDLAKVKTLIAKRSKSTVGASLNLVNGVVKSPKAKDTSTPSKPLSARDKRRQVKLNRYRSKANARRRAAGIPEFNYDKLSTSKANTEITIPNPVNVVKDNDVGVKDSNTKSSRSASLLAKARERANKMRRAAGRPEVDYTSLTSKTASNQGGANVDSNTVTIQPMSLSKPSTGKGELVPHKVTDGVEGKIAEYNDIIHEASKATGVDVNLIRSIIRQHSAGDPKAKTQSGGVGLMGLTPQMAKVVNVSNRSDPRQSIMGGAEYIKQQLQLFNGVPELALASYNAGSDNVKKAITKAGNSNPETVLNTLSEVTGKQSKETQDNVVKITNDYRKRLGDTSTGSTVNNKGVINSTKVSSTTPTIVSIKPRKPIVEATDGAPSTTSSIGNLDKSTKVMNNQPSDEEVIGLQEENTLRARATVENQGNQLSLQNDHMLAVNTDQLIELRVLNQRFGELVTRLTPSDEVKDTHALEKEENDRYKEASKNTSSPSRFKRRTVTGNPPINLGRKVI